MIERLLPLKVSCEAARADEVGAPLFPEEAALVYGAVESRRREFATARCCARRALLRLGVAPAPILRGAKREPLWPKGIIGSITHCRGYRAAAVALGQDMLALGIDAEPNEAFPPGVARRVLSAEERAWLPRMPGGVHWERVVFSAKESIYKAWFPLTGRWLDFGDAVVSINVEQRTFAARLRAQPTYRGLEKVKGRFLIADGLILTAVAVPHP